MEEKRLHGAVVPRCFNGQLMSINGEQGHSTETNGIHGAPIEKGIKQPVGYLIPFFVLSETRCKDSAFLEYMQIKV